MAANHYASDRAEALWRYVQPRVLRPDRLGYSCLRGSKKSRGCPILTERSVRGRLGI